VLSGSVPVYLDMMSALQNNQILCFGLAAVTATLLMAWFFRSWRFSFIAMVPSLLPCATAIGTLGLWDYGLDPGSTMVATIIIGVAVDDSIHLLTRFIRLRRRGVDEERAISEALSHVGQAAIVSSLVLTMGFWSLTLSSFSTVASFGFLAGQAILTALLADLYLLPALLSTGPVRQWLPNPTPRLRT